MAESIEIVLRSEREILKNRRKQVFGQAPDDGELASTLFGICFSGGGIRSATFNLGILQGLASCGMLKVADYLSTVSGGGYIGSWFHGVVKRAPYMHLKDATGNAYTDYETYLAAEDRKPGEPSHDPISFLRKYSNYLSPQLGLLSADAWVIATTWLRNTLLNQIILYLSLAAVLMFPIVIGNFARVLEARAYFSEYIPVLLGIILIALAVWSIERISRNLNPIVNQELDLPGGKTAPDDDRSVWWIIGGVWLTCVLLSFLIAAGSFNPLDPLTGSVTYVVLLILFGRALAHGGYWICYRTRNQDQPWWKLRRALLAAVIVLVCSAVTLALLTLVQKALWFLRHTQISFPEATSGVLPVPTGVWHCMSWGPFLIGLALAVGVALQVGLMGVDFPDSAREWYSRFSAKLFITGSAWVSWFAVAVFAPVGVIWLFHSLKGLGTAAIAAWIASTAAGVLSGKSPATSGHSANDLSQQKTRSSSLEFLAKYAPPIALLGLLIAVSTACFWFVNSIFGRFQEIPSQDPALSLNAAGAGLLTLAVTVLMGIALALSARIDINEFSLNHFYKNRLVRCYLGASHGRDRSPNRFTGFDPTDDILLSDLVPGENYSGPFAILNCALNLNHGSELAWQERKASAFVFTPKYSGYVPNHNPNGFVETKAFSYPKGPHIGMAVSISGAAVNPNWGYHTNPFTAFLLTLFDVRLGWWAGNTRFAPAAKTPGPSFGLIYLVAELLGLTTEDRNYVNLSDGGHFENLGLYELARRKCRFIIVGDGEQDESYQFESLGGAIRKSRIDFGYSITISPKSVFLNNGLSQAHCAVGTIDYNDGKPGTLLYLKASLTGDETYDVTQYKKADPAFPHDTTLNQFFTESKFESYRILGKHVIEKVFQRVPKPTSPSDLEATFGLLQQNWVSPTTAAAGAFTKHASTYSRLVERLAEDDALRFLDPEIFPGIAPAPRPDTVSAQMRQGRLLIIDFLQLMEDVYLDLNLEDQDQFDHPENGGWTELFRHWKKGATFGEVWNAAGKTYSASFCRFYQRL